MNRALVVALVGFAASSLASANVTWTFGSGASSGGSQLANGTTYTVSGNSLQVYGVQENSYLIGGAYRASGTLQSTSYTNSTINALFQVSNGVYGTGIAPYDPAQCGGLTSGCTNMNSQDGLTDAVGAAASAPTGATQNLVLVHLTATANESLTFLLNSVHQSPADTFNIWTYYQTAAPTALGTNSGTSWSNEVVVGQSLNLSSPATGSATINTGSNSGSLWVAIQADCHYLLLNSITAVPGAATPEPRFYGMLLTGLLGVAIAIARRRASTVV